MARMETSRKLPGSSRRKDGQTTATQPGPQLCMKLGSSLPPSFVLPSPNTTKLCPNGQGCPQHAKWLSYIPATSSIKQEMKCCFTELITEAFPKRLDTQGKIHQCELSQPWVKKGLESALHILWKYSGQQLQALRTDSQLWQSSAGYFQA